MILTICFLPKLLSVLKRTNRALTPSTDYGKTTIGAAFAHKDGEGFDVTLDALPVSGRVTLRKVDEKKSHEGTA